MHSKRDSGFGHVLFVVGVVGKAIDGVLETIGGILLFFVTPEHTARIVRALSENELGGDAHDFVAVHVANAVRHLSGDTRIFAALYLLVHGVVKVVLVAGLLAKIRVAYPTALIAFTLFLCYQVYRYIDKPSTGMLVLSIIDVFVIVITWFEYRRLLAAHAFRT